MHGLKHEEMGKQQISQMAVKDCEITFCLCMNPVHTPEKSRSIGSESCCARSECLNICGCMPHKLHTHWKLCAYRSNFPFATGVPVPGATVGVATAAMAKFKQACVPRSAVILSSGRGARSPQSPAERAHTAQMLGMSRCRSLLGVQENPVLLLRYAAQRRRALGASTSTPATTL